jgi:hypothetical protein
MLTVGELVMLNSALLLLVASVAGQAVEPNIPKDVLASMDYYVGKWKGEGTDDGEVLRIQFTTRWAPGKHCTIMNMRSKTPDGVVLGTLVSGWDALNKEVVDVSYMSDGSRSVERWKIVSPKVEEATSTGVNADGKPTDSKFRIEKRSPDELVLTITNRVEGDEKKPDLVIKYVRVEQAEKPR